MFHKKLVKMYAFWLLIITVWFVTGVQSKSCLAVKLEHEKECQANEHDNYIDCVRTRMKRHSSDCKYDDECFDCDCEFCQYSECGGECNECCNSCCSNYVQCHTNHCCHKQCHAECRSYNCRSSCRKSCYDSIAREQKETLLDRQVIERIVDRTIIGNAGASNLQSNTSNVNSHNITTVINLKNVINNTNLIDVPINLNYTNRNNISLTAGGGGSSSGGFTDIDNCCLVIGPRKCNYISVSPYIECRYLRSKQCGSYCTASVIHQELLPVQQPGCNTFNAAGQPTCQQQSAYIPQPQPSCSYTNTWPYVKCDAQPLASCEGCYSHYFNSQAKDYKSCPPQCYDDFGAGPLYRQGPFYQPSYSHMPPCNFLPQGCGGLGGFGAMGGLGGFGMMGPYGGGLGGYMGGLGPGYGGGFGYGPQLPFSQPGFSFSPEQQILLNPKLLGNTGINEQTFPNSSGESRRARHTYHLGNTRNSRIIHNSKMKHRPTSTDNSPSTRKDLLDRVRIKEYNSEDQLVPIYEYPDQEVHIDVKITDPNKNNSLPLVKNAQNTKENNVEVVKV